MLVCPFEDPEVVCCVDVVDVPVDADLFTDVSVVVELVVLLPDDVAVVVLDEELVDEEVDPEPDTGGQTVIVAVLVVLTELPSDTANSNDSVPKYPLSGTYTNEPSELIVKVP